QVARNTLHGAGAPAPAAFALRATRAELGITLPRVTCNLLPATCYLQPEPSHSCKTPPLGFPPNRGEPHAQHRSLPAGPLPRLLSAAPPFGQAPHPGAAPAVPRAGVPAVRHHLPPPAGLRDRKRTR